MPSEDIFALLGLRPDATEEEVRRAYKDASKKGEFRHPDAGGDRARWEELHDAYDAWDATPTDSRIGDDDAEYVFPDGEPSLSTRRITWTIGTESAPIPVEVTLRFPGGLENVGGPYGPTSWAGRFWWLEADQTFTGIGDDIFRATVVPSDSSTLEQCGSCEEHINFEANGRTVALTIQLSVTTKRATGTFRPGSTTSRPWEPPPHPPRAKPGSRGGKERRFPPSRSPAVPESAFAGIPRPYRSALGAALFMLAPILAIVLVIRPRVGLDVVEGLGLYYSGHVVSGDCPHQRVSLLVSLLGLLLALGGVLLIAATMLAAVVGCPVGMFATSGYGWRAMRSGSPAALSLGITSLCIALAALLSAAFSVWLELSIFHHLTNVCITFR
jgi:hypothetical protein